MLHNLTDRETFLIKATILVLSAILIYTFLYRDTQGRIEYLTRGVARKQENLKTLVELGRRYRDLSARLHNFDSQFVGEAADSLFSELEGVADQVGIRGNIKSMKPQEVPLGTMYSESGVTVSLEEVTLAQLGQFLYNLVQLGSGGRRLTKLNVQVRAADRNLLDANFVLSTLKPQAAE